MHCISRKQDISGAIKPDLSGYEHDEHTSQKNLAYTFSFTDHMNIHTQSNWSQKYKPDLSGYDMSTEESTKKF